MTEIRTAHTADLDEVSLGAARRLLWDVFPEDDAMTEADWEHCLGGMHVHVWDGDELVGHAALVMRRLLVGERALRTGYVEGVAVHRGHQRRGIGAALMTEVERMIRGAYDLGALGASEIGRPFYESRGWKPWPAPTRQLTRTGIQPTPDEDGWIYYYPAAAPLDTAAPITCDLRPGEPW